MIKVFSIIMSFNANNHLKILTIGKRVMLLCLLCFFFVPHAMAQDTIIPVDEEKQMADTVKPHSAKKATWMSLCLPGLGQAYNKQYIKIPFIYAGFGTAAYFYSLNIKEYRLYKEAYAAKISNDTTYSGKLAAYPVDKIQSYKNFYRRNLELTYISFALIYIFNVIDAAVYAHLFDYDISDDLSLSVKPEIKPLMQAQHFSAGLTFKFKF